MNQLSIKELIASVNPSKRREAHLRQTNDNPELEALSMPVQGSESKNRQSSDVNIGELLREEDFSV